MELHRRRKESAECIGSYSDLQEDCGYHSGICPNHDNRNNTVHNLLRVESPDRINEKLE